MEYKDKDIHERIYRFVLRVIRLAMSLPKNPLNDNSRFQIIKAVTSMGANDQEADAASSRKEFASKYGIVKKENKEVNYWLRIIADTNPNLKTRMKDIYQEGVEILKVVSRIIYNSQQRR